MDTGLISNLIDVSLCLVALFISIRSFDIYTTIRYTRLFILGIAMVLLSLSAAADFTSNYVKGTTLNTDWFLYIAQITGFLLIFLSLVWSSGRALNRLMVLSIFTLPPLLFLLVWSPALPVMPDGFMPILLESLRCLICFLILFAYYFAFVNKATHINRFMTLAFLLISLGNALSMMESFAYRFHSHILGNIGNLTKIVGLVALVIAISWN